jgi:hypothetical protein
MVLDRFTEKEKVVIVFCCILLAAACVLFFIGYTGQVRERDHSIQLHLQDAAGQIAGQVNGDGLSDLKPGDEGSPRYLYFVNTVYNARINDSDLVTAYILRVDNGTIRYVIDDTYFTNGLDPNVARIGDLVTEDKEIITAASAGPTYSREIYTSKWGSYLSGYAPVKDSNGTVVGILGVDETADTVHKYEYSRLFNLVEVV